MIAFLPSHSVPTLVGLAILTAGLFSFQGILDAIRGRVLLRIGGAINDEMSARAYDAVVRLPLKTRGGGDGLQPIRDLDQIRSFLGSPRSGSPIRSALDAALCRNLFPLSSVDRHRRRRAARSF